MPNLVICDRFPLPAVEIELSDADWQKFADGEDVDFGPLIEAALTAQEE